MTVYVDPLFGTPSQNDAAFEVGKRHNHQWCHLYPFPVTGENIAELHQIAQAIGLKRRWFQQGGGSIPHYDLVPTKRVLALKRGAVDISREESIKHFKAYRISIRPLSALERYYLNAQLLAEMVTNLLPETQHSLVKVNYPTPETMPLEGKEIPLYWSMCVTYNGKDYLIRVNSYELAIAVSEARLEATASQVVNDIVRRFYLVPD